MKAFLPAAMADCLPAHVEEEEVARHDQGQHGEDEDIEIGEEARDVGILVHVADGVDVDEESDAGDHEEHHPRELIHLHEHTRLEAARADPGEELPHVRLAVEHAREHEARGEEREEESGNGDPVRGVSDAPPEKRVGERAHERKERNQPDES